MSLIWSEVVGVEQTALSIPGDVSTRTYLGPLNPRTDSALFVVHKDLLTDDKKASYANFRTRFQAALALGQCNSGLRGLSGRLGGFGTLRAPYLPPVA